MSGSASAFIGSKEKWFEKFARVGLVCKGIVYLLMGALSVLAAFGLSREEGDKSGAFNLILEQPFGQVILVAIALGLLGYVLLRIFQAFKDTENKGTDARGVMDRLGYAMSAGLYLLVAVYALRLVFSGASAGEGDSREFVVSKVLEFSGGQYIVGVAALVVAGMGIYQIVRGVTGRFMKKVRLLQSNLKDVFKTAGTMGYVCRGIVLGVIGYFLFRAAWAHNPGSAQGTGAAFDFLQNKFGSLMMALVALGLAGYGVFCFVKARYQQIDFD